MAWKLTILGCFVTGLSVGGPGTEGSGLVAKTTRVKSTRALCPPPELLLPKPKRVPDSSWYYRGVVTAVSVNWVELGIGWTGEESSRKKWMEENKKPKRITAVGTTAGGDADGEGRLQTHRVIDLKVGDVITIDTQAARDGEEWTTQIWILRRPGGKIPPQHGDSLKGTAHATHLRDQAEQDWEEKGVPIPKRYLDPNGRAPWTKPPYPPVAPQPREVK